MLKRQAILSWYHDSATKFNQGVACSLRQFSSITAKEGDNRPPTDPLQRLYTHLDQAGRRDVAGKEVQILFKQSVISNDQRVRIIGCDARAPDAAYFPQREPIDARSLRSHISLSGEVPPNILRAPPSIKRLQVSKGPGASSRLRRTARTRPLMPSNMAKFPGKLEQQSQRPLRRRRESAFEMDDDKMDTAEEAYYLAKQEQEKPKPVRYNPEGYDIEKLKQTWPSLPIGGTANVGSILEKLTWMGNRFVSGYDSPQELAKRIYEGKRVLFTGEEEKNQVMELANEMAVELAKKFPERKGQIVQPEDISFEVISEEDRKILLGKLVSGKCPKLEAAKLGASPLIADVVRNLRNNETYQTVESAQFMEKLIGSLPSATTSSRSKRA